LFVHRVLTVMLFRVNRIPVQKCIDAKEIALRNSPISRGAKESAHEACVSVHARDPLDMQEIFETRHVLNQAM
jgi:hypothetical protein